MEIEEQRNNDALKNELLEKQIHDVVNEFESLKTLNLEYIQTNERLNNEINNLKELNEQQVILNDTMLDKNKEIFKGSKRNIFWGVSILSLISILLCFQFIDKRINDKITSQMTQIDVHLKLNQDSLAQSQKLQVDIESKESTLKKIEKLQIEQLIDSKNEFKETLKNFKANTVRTNEAIQEIKYDYALALSNFKTLLNQKETEIKDLKNQFRNKLAKISQEQQEKVLVEKVPVIKIVPQTILKKKIKTKSVYSLLQEAFKFQKQQQYDSAIKSYKAVLKINPKKDIVYYNLGIIYGNQKKYAQAINAYKKSLKLNPKRNLTFTNIFELQLITNQEFEKSILSKYKTFHQDKKISLIKYEMLDIFKDVKVQKNVDKKLHDWKKNYEKTSLGNWSFKMLKTWINEESDKTTKSNLNIVLKTFEGHK